ncbi:SNF1 [Candida margitis]|uniref:SNF1 n=1 Tax=Candida margitis TaxID=1775924 RepID=UPI002226CB69|nr:SNF1 [Candida margitis]KAI5967934.1 SNF1 [Candida margitis]
MSEPTGMHVDQSIPQSNQPPAQQQQQQQQPIQQPQPQHSSQQQQQQQQQHHHHHHGHHHHKDQNANTATYIGKYQVLKTLGEGSFGKVKLAQHTVTGQKVALKIINRKTLAKSDMQGRIEREISYLRLLRHPHIIKLYDVIKSKDDIIMVIEYAGKELFDYIVQRGKMPEDEARRFFQQIIAAVEYCHRHKIVHRDLKPENLLLDDQLNVKIADFGLSNIMTDGNFLKTSCGSPNYAAPEVISGKLYAGPEVDVWSAGVILYVMLCGRLPFDDEFIPALFKKISNGVYTLPSYLSSGAKHILTRMLVVNPLNRITIHEIMEDEWFKQGMPDYLLPPDLSKNKHKKIDIDEDVIRALHVTMGYDRDEIINIIEKCNKHSSPQSQKNEILDAYLLMKENHSLVKDLKKSKSDNVDSFLSSSPPPTSSMGSDGGSAGGSAGTSDGSSNAGGTAAAGGYPSHPATSSAPGVQQSLTYQTLAGVPDLSQLPNSTIAILPTSLPSIHRAFMSEHQPGQNQQQYQPTPTKKSKTRWHFGIRSRSYPLDVMGEIYRALKNLGAEWAKPTEEELWTIRVRWKYEAAAAGVASTGGVSSKTPNLMKMQIQLFQLEPNNYLVDFKFDGWESEEQASSGNTEDASANAKDPHRHQDLDEVGSFSAYPFLHLATRLIMELAVNSQSA